MRGVKARERAGGQGGLGLVASTVFGIVTALGWAGMAGAATPLTGATQVAVGGSHACAVLEAGGVVCWGAPGAALGREGAGHAAAPVSGLTGIVAGLSTGTRHSCAITAASGAVHCWGESLAGQAGSGAQYFMRPTQVRGLPHGVQEVAAGSSHSCGVVGRSAWCWGYNGSGELGLGNNDPVAGPTPVPTLATGVTKVAAGNSFSCGIQAGSAKCWGTGLQGQIGDGTALTRVVPTQVATLTAGVTAIAAGGGARVRHRRRRSQVLGQGWGWTARRWSACATQRPRQRARCLELHDCDRRRGVAHLRAALGWCGAVLGLQRVRATG